MKLSSSTGQAAPGHRSEERRTPVTTGAKSRQVPALVPTLFATFLELCFIPHGLFLIMSHFFKSQITLVILAQNVFF